jgi:hypothetical protein
MSTLYASFVDAASAERAAGALLDNGAMAADISIIANEAYHTARAQANAIEAENAAKGGISTTTPSDVAAGAAKGASIGLGVGIAAALASIFIPGLGLILGGGALATALAGGAATVLAGGAAGGVVGYLHDQGVPDEAATRYSSDFVAGGAILAVAIPTGSMLTGEVEAILAKYGAANVATYYSNRAVVDTPAVAVTQEPLVVNNPNIDPIATTVVEPLIEQPAMSTHTVVDAATGEARVVATQIQPTSVDPVTGVPIAAVAVDPLTAVERPLAVDSVTSEVVAPAVAPITSPVTGVTIDPVTGLPIQPVPATPVSASGPSVVIDPVSGMERAATAADGLAGDTVAPVEADVLLEEEPPVVRRTDVELY